RIEHGLLRRRVGRQAEQRLSDGTDRQAGCRQVVVGNGCPGRRILELDAGSSAAYSRSKRSAIVGTKLPKISRHFARRKELISRRAAGTVESLALIISKEEQLVLED